MGEVTVKRNVYGKTDENGQVQHMYLLDQFLGFETIGLTMSSFSRKNVRTYLPKILQSGGSNYRSNKPNNKPSGGLGLIQCGAKAKKVEYEEIKVIKITS